MLSTDGRGPLMQVFHFRQSQQQGLAAGLRGASAAVHADIEGGPHSGEHILGDLAAVS